MSIKVPIRTVYDASDNAIGLSEMQSGETVGYAHGGTGLSSLGSAGQVLQVNSGGNGFEFGSKTSVNLNPYITVANANINYVTKSTAVSTNNAIINLINDRMQVANANVTFVTKAVALTANNSLNNLINDRIQVANASAIYATKAYAAANTYVNAQIGASNTNIRNYADTTFETKAIALASNNALLGLINDRLQVANAAALYQTIAIERAALANTNTRLDVLEAGGALATNTYIVANFLQKTSSSVQNTTGELRINSSSATTGTHVKDGSVTIFANGGTPAYVDFYCEVSNAHRARIKSAAHSDYSGNIDLTLPTTNGVIATQEYAASNTYVNNTFETKAVALASNTTLKNLIDDRMQVANVSSLVTTEVNALIDSAPGALNTLNELAAALGDDANFSTTVTNSIATKAANTYVNSTFETKAVALAANTAQNNLILDRMQVANAAIIGRDMIAGAGMTGGGTLAADRTFNVIGGTGITVNANDVQTNDSEIVHDNLSGFVANEHIDHTSVTLTAGNGLTGGGTIASNRTFAVGAGTGIVVNANDVAVDVGTSANKIVQLNSSGELPAVDGSNLTGIGATVTDKSDDVNYNIIFTNETSGSQALAGIDNSALTYNPSTGALSAGDFISSSDINLKENVKTINNPVDKVDSLRGVNFNWKENGEYAMGVIAQEIEKIVPEVVSETNGVKGVNYGAVIGLLIEAVKEQKQQIDELRNIINNV